MSMSDRIAILNHGRIDQIGSPGEVYERPTNPFVGQFLGEANLIEGSVAGVVGDAVRFTLASGQELHAPATNSIESGRGMLFIRPERVEIARGTMTASRPQTNAIAGRIHRCSFLGNILRYAVDVDGILLVTVDLQNAVGVAPIPAGTPVVLRWPVAESLILPAET